MGNKTIRMAGALVILLGVAVAAIAQMPGDEPEPATIQPGTATAVENDGKDEGTSATAPAGDSEFVYRIGVLANVSTDNFWAFYGGDASVWNSYILGPTKPALYRVDPLTGTLIPELASEMTAPSPVEAGWEVLVELDESLEWSDGTPITAGDFVFTFHTVRAAGLEGSWSAAFGKNLVSAHADGSHLVRLVFAERPTLADWPHAVGTAPVMPAHVWSGLVEDKNIYEVYRLPGEKDLGGGPLALESVGGELTRSVANPGYHLATTPDVVEYHVFEDEAAAVDALSRGEIDTVLTPKGLSEANTEAMETHDAIEIVTSPSSGVRYLGFNLERAPMSHSAFRTALALLLDRQTLAAELIGDADVAHTFIREESDLWHDPVRAAEIEALYDGDLETRLGSAIAGLEAAGYTWETIPSVAEDGGMTAGEGLRIGGTEPAPLTILTSGDAYDPDRPRYAVEIAATLAVLGFDARPVTTDFDTVVDLAFEPGDDGRRQYDMYLLGWSLGSPTLPEYYRPLFASDGAMNSTGYASDAFDRVLAAYEAAHTHTEAHQALWEMEETLATDLPYLLLYRSPLREAYRSDRVAYGVDAAVGGLQGRLGAIADVRPSP